jgi:ABC-type polysaccharide/polyol phosphate export permease
VNTYADVYRYRELFSNLFRRDLQAKYRGSALGVVWTVANPLLLMAVYLLVFGVVWHSPFANGGHYPLFLLSGLAVWTFVAAALQSATRSMLDNANLIRKTRFPRQLVPLSVVGAHVVAFAAMLVLLLVLNFVVLSRVRATEWLAIPLAVLAVAFVAGISLMAASLNAIFRDVEFIVSALLVPWFFLTPVIYPLSQLADHQHVVWAIHWLNPLSPIIESIRAPLFYGVLPPLADVTYAVLVSLLSLAVGAWVFSRVDDQIAIEV